MQFYSRSCRVIFLLLTITALGSCTTASQPLPYLSPGKVAIIPAQFVPESNLNTYAQGKSAAAGQLGMEGASEGAVAGALAPLQDPYGVILYPVIAPFTILAGTLVGGTIGKYKIAVPVLEVIVLKTNGIIPVKIIIRPLKSFSQSDRYPIHIHCLPGGITFLHPIRLNRPVGGYRECIWFLPSKPGFHEGEVIGLVVFPIGLGSETELLTISRGDWSPGFQIEHPAD